LIIPRIIIVLAAIAAVAVHATTAAGESAVYASLKWRSVGPAISGGRATSVAGTDLDPYLYYAGAAGGGIWRSQDAGASWKAVFESMPVNAIGAVAIAPSNKNVVWVGTGEANPRNDVSWGDGVWLSTDGGEKWQHRGLDATSQISRILVEPHDPNAALVGALGDPWKDSEDRGVYRTTDAGKTWTKTLYVSAHSGASDLAWDPYHPSVVFAGIWQYRRYPWSIESGGPDGGLYRSTDSGVTWTKLTGNGLPAGLTGRIGIAVAPHHPERVYALIQSKEGILWRSDDGGDHWRLLSNDTVLDQRPFYFSHLAVDPTNPDHVIFLSEWITESKDGGRTFKHIAKSVHVDHHDLWWSANGKRLIEADDGSVALSFDGAKSWNYPGNMPIGQVYKVGFDLREPYRVCGGLQDNTTMCGASDSFDAEGILNRDWFSVNGGDGQVGWPDPFDPQLIWNSIEDGSLGIFDVRSQQNVDVSPYPRDTNGMALQGIPYRFNWSFPFAFSPQDGHVVYAGANVVFRTSDRGRHWSVISPDLTRNEAEHQQRSGGPITLDVSGAEFFNTVTEIAPSAPQPGLIWVGTDDGLIQITGDGGATWRKVSIPDIGPYGFVESIDPSVYAGGTAFVAITRHTMGDRRPYAYVTDDYGVHWKSIVANLPADQPVRCVRQDQRNADILYAGLEESIWVSFDRGQSWHSLQLNLPTASVRDIRVQPRANDLIIGTHGRSMFILDDLAPLQQLNTAEQAGVFLFQPRSAYRIYQWSREDTQDNLAPANTWTGDNPDVGVLVNYYLAKSVKPRPTIDVLDAHGNLVRRLAGTHVVDNKPEYYVLNKPGVNRVAWNLTETGPVKRLSATREFQGSDDGAEVVPGRYTIVLRVSGHAYAHNVNVLPDPRASWTQADYLARHDFEAMLNGELSQIDTALNNLDALKHRLAASVKALRQANPASSLAVLGESVLAKEAVVEDAMTSNPRNDEDGILFEDKVRERIVTLLGSLGESQQPPFAAHEQQAAEIKVELDRVLASYQKFMSEDVASFDAAVKAAGLH
jgi:photosystem II stability/assembly factor-like uncharacterized protein